MTLTTNIVMAKTHIQLPYGVVLNEPTFKFRNLKNHEANNYLKNLPYLDEANKPEVQNDALNLIKNKASFRKYLLATSDLGNSLQDIINQVVTDGEFNDVGLRRVLDSQNNDIFKISNPISLIFKNTQKFNLQNPVLGNLVNQLYASGLTDENVKGLLQKGDEKVIQARLDTLKSLIIKTTTTTTTTATITLVLSTNGLTTMTTMTTTVVGHVSPMTSLTVNALAQTFFYQTSLNLTQK